MAAAMRPGDWCCPSCSNHNYADKMLCNRCGIPKPTVPTGSFGYGFNGMATPLHNGFGMTAGGGGFSNGVRASPYQQDKPNSKTSTAMRPGDWCCPMCGNHNYASKTACNKCKVSKFAAMGGGLVMSSPFGMTGSHPGDWNCRACGNTNYASRDSCNRCSVPKAAFISKSGMRPGDWLCQSCQNHNYADKVICNKCKGPKETASLNMKSMRPGDWFCQKCNNHNYADKLACNRCHAAKV